MIFLLMSKLGTKVPKANLWISYPRSEERGKSEERVKSKEWDKFKEWDKSTGEANQMNIKNLIGITNLNSRQRSMSRST